jgi:hypothetical protein
MGQLRGIYGTTTKVVGGGDKTICNEEHRACEKELNWSSGTNLFVVRRK